MRFKLKRIYETTAKSDGCRILVDRLWPRGMTKEDAALDHWAKVLAPSNELRKWFGHDPGKSDAFARRYRAELNDRRDEVMAFLNELGRSTVTLLYAAKDEHHNHAIVLKAYLEDLVE